MRCTHRDERDVRAEALEEAATMVEQFGEWELYPPIVRVDAKNLAARIRTRIGTPGKQIWRNVDDEKALARMRDPKRGREF